MPLSTKNLMDGLGETNLTTEEYFAIERAESVNEARLLLDDFRAQRAAAESMIFELRALADQRIYVGTTTRHLLLDAASMIESKENHIALLRGQVAGLEHRAEAADRRRFAK